jgi:1-phosphofructokinase
MSPAIDATVAVPAWPRDGAVFKDVAEEENIGGKGLNVARWLALRGADVACGGLLGEENAAPFERELARCGVRDVFLRVPGLTRRNEMVVTPEGSFKLNRAAFPNLATDFDAGAVLDGADGEPGVAILSGSLPPSVPKSFYADAVRVLKERGWRVALDASGDALRLGFEAAPDVVKPNAEECAELAGFVPSSPEDFRRASAIIGKHVPFAVISAGESGAWFNGEFVAAPHVEALDTTAAGDTLLAEFCWRMWGKGEELGAAASWAVAAGSAAVTMPGGSPPPPVLVERLMEEIK